MNEADTLRKLASDPELFRLSLIVDADDGPVQFGGVIDPWQAADFRAMDAAWKRVIGRDAPVEHSRAWLERGRGHSKTSDIAIAVCWALFASPRKLSGVCAAADQDQAGLIRNAIESLVRLNAWLNDLLKVSKNSVTNIHTSSELTILASDVASSYGLTPDFVVADELTHWRKPDLWESLFSSSGKRRHCVLIVIGNAGFSESWQWELRQKICTDSRWYFHSLQGPQASWINAETLAEQRRLLPDRAYRRLWLNEWSEGSGDALDADDLRACITLNGPSDPGRGWTFCAGLDLSTRRDHTALVVLAKHSGWVEHNVTARRRHPDSTIRSLVDHGFLDDFREPEDESTYHNGTGRIRLVSCDVWAPTRGKIDLSAIEDRCRELHGRYRLQSIGVDQWQAELLIQRLRKQNVPAVGIEFTGTNLKAMAGAVVDGFRERQIELFDHKVLIQDLRSLRVVERSYGYRLEAGAGSATGHGDAGTAFSLAMMQARRVRASSSDLACQDVVLYP